MTFRLDEIYFINFSCCWTRRKKFLKNSRWVRQFTIQIFQLVSFEAKTIFNVLPTHVDNFQGDNLNLFNFISQQKTYRENRMSKTQMSILNSFSRRHKMSEKKNIKNLQMGERVCWWKQECGFLNSNQFQKNHCHSKIQRRIIKSFDPWSLFLLSTTHRLLLIIAMCHYVYRMYLS